MRPESKNLEYKERITDKFLKTVSAYANSHTGRIIFGVRDDLSISGLPDLDQSSLVIENKIRDHISPLPDYEIHCEEKDKLLILTVYKGSSEPYYYDSIAYVRKAASSIPADRTILTEMALKSRNLSWDQLPASEQELQFSTLSAELQKKLGIEKAGKDTLISLDLLNEKTGYTNAGMLAADQNRAPGIDIVRFGNSENEILTRRILERISIIEQYQSAFDFFTMFYKKEIIDGMERKEIYSIPADAFREAVANAIVHRNYLLSNMNIQIAMYSDHIEITSPGGLPEGMSPESYLNANISAPRNTTIAWLFLRLNYIERLGTGIRRILSSYEKNAQKPSFIFDDNYIQVSLPVLGNRQTGEKESDEKQMILTYLSIYGPQKRRKIEQYTGFSKTKTINILNTLLIENKIIKNGKSRSIEYSIANEYAE